MRNLSKTIVSKKATLIIKDKNMKKFIMIAIIAVMTVFNTAAADEVDTALYIYSKVPGATTEDARECARVWAHGGTYMVKIKNIKLECAKHLLTESFDYE